MADDPKYANPASQGIVGQAIQNRASRMDAIEAAAAGPKPATPAPPAPASPAAPATQSPTLLQRVKGLVGMKAGGPVPGKGSGDKVPVMAEPGEYMVRKSAVPAANAAAKKAGFKSLDHLNKSSHNPDNRVPASAKHKPGSRGGAMAGMKCGGKVK